MDPGSEFRNQEILNELWNKHEHWPKMMRIILLGLDYPLVETLEEDTKKDLVHMMARGNHKSAQSPVENPTKLSENCKSQVEKGWMLPIPEKYLPKVNGAAVIPVGVHTQYTIGGDGARKVKRRTTHDTSFDPPSKK